MAASQNTFTGFHVFLWFFGFFVVIIVVNAVFIYQALSTHSGVVTERAYEKGLAFDETLRQARHQPKLETTASYEHNRLIWRLKDEHGKNLNGAHVTAKIIRPIKDGNDFKVKLEPQGEGLYLAVLELPLKGQWTAKLSAQWNNKHYQKTHRFITK